MQTGAIAYRVADFLKEHPPFVGIALDDLLALAARGRVKFHERDEYLVWQGQSYSPYVQIIQQGAVSLWEEVDGREVLRDIRGPGDMVGVERFTGAAKSPYSARSNGDVVIYALPVTEFLPMLDRYPHAARYIEGHATPGAVYREPERAGVDELFVAELAGHPEPVTCEGATPISEVVRLLLDSGAGVVAVMEGPSVEGMVTMDDVLRWVARGCPEPRKAASIARAVPVVLPVETTVSRCILEMADAEAAALTPDGSRRFGILKMVTAETLQPAFGDNPLLLLRELRHATDVEALRILHARARALLLEHLRRPGSVDWLCGLGDRLNAAMAKRLVELGGLGSSNWTWCFRGTAGRGELMTALEPGVAVICPDAAEVERARECRERLRESFGECGYVRRVEPEWITGLAVGDVGEWRGRFERWIGDPISSGMYAARPMLDLRPAFGPAEPWDAVRQRACEVLQGEPGFVKLLANDCLSAMPPLTFFDGAVVEGGGESAGTFELGRRALGPMVEVGRVFGAAVGSVGGMTTLERLRRARQRMPDQDGVFRRAEEALRVLLYLQARHGLKTVGSGEEIAPEQLSRLDQQALKSGFRAIRALVSMTMDLYWHEAR